MRAMRDHRDCGDAARLSAGHARIFFPCWMGMGNQSIRLCSGGISAKAAALRAAPTMDGSDSYFQCLGLGRIERHIGKLKARFNCRSNNRRVIPFGCCMHHRHDTGIPKSEQIQQRNISAPPVGLGAYLYLSALWKLSADWLRCLAHFAGANRFIFVRIPERISRQLDRICCNCRLEQRSRSKRNSRTRQWDRLFSICTLNPLDLFLRNLSPLFTWESFDVRPEPTSVPKKSPDSRRGLY